MGGYFLVEIKIILTKLNQFRNLELNLKIKNLTLN